MCPFNQDLNEPGHCLHWQSWVFWDTVLPYSICHHVPRPETDPAQTWLLCSHSLHDHCSNQLLEIQRSKVSYVRSLTQVSPAYSKGGEGLHSFPEAVQKNPFPWSYGWNFVPLNWDTELSALQLCRVPTLLGWSSPSSVFKAAMTSLSCAWISLLLLTCLASMWSR